MAENISEIRQNAKAIIATEEIEVVESTSESEDSIVESGSPVGNPHEDLIKDFGYCRGSPEIIASHQLLPLYNDTGKKTPVVDFIMSQFNLDFMIQNLAKKHIDDVENNPFRNSTIGDYLSDIQSAVDIVVGIESSFNFKEILNNNIDLVSSDNQTGQDSIKELWDAIGFNLPFNNQSTATIFYSFCNVLEEDIIASFSYEKVVFPEDGGLITSEPESTEFTPQQKEKLDEIADNKLSGQYDFGRVGDAPADSGAGSGQGGSAGSGNNSTTADTQSDGSGGSGDDGNSSDEGSFAVPV